MKFLTVIAASLMLLSACAMPLDVYSDHDAKQNFTAYRHFAWISDQPMMGPTQELARLSPLNRRRIEEAVEGELVTKGFQKTDRSAADFVVSYTVGARNRIDVQSYPAPYAGPWYWGWSYFGNEVDVRTYREGTLAIDVFDARSHQPVWHGWGSKRISEYDVRHAAEQIPSAVAAILEDFPPH